MLVSVRVEKSHLEEETRIRFDFLQLSPATLFHLVSSISVQP